MSSEEPLSGKPAQPQWQPLSKIDRRVLGVLIEKAKTTPAGYPLSLNAVVTACNQKSNRDPLMHLDDETVLASLERLRQMKAVTMVQGSGRVEKYRHYGYDWFQVDKVELSVLAELLLRGPQTLGELRSRASRMDPINSLDELSEIVSRLEAKGLVTFLQSTGRAKVVAHCLYPPAELEKIRAAATAEQPDGANAPSSSTAALPEVGSSRPPSAGNEQLAEDVERLKRELAEQRELVTKLARNLDYLMRELGTSAPETPTPRDPA